MKAYNSVQTLILDFTKFELMKFKNGEILYHVINQIYNKNNYYDTPPENLKNEIYNLIQLDDLENYKNNFLKEINKHENFMVLRNGKIIYKYTKDLIQCSKCGNYGNIWEGNDQCLCYLYELCYC
jgi:hypothetical protein